MPRELVVLSVPTSAAVPWPELTPAEATVANLALTGLASEAIARRRRVAHATVAKQLASIYRKLGIGSRAELAALAARRTSVS